MTRTLDDLILFALPISAEKRILRMLRKLWVLPVDIHLSAHTSELRFRARYYSNLAQTPTLPMFEKPITDWDMVMKWAFDRVVGMLLSSPSHPNKNQHVTASRFRKWLDATRHRLLKARD